MSDRENTPQYVEIDCKVIVKRDESVRVDTGAISDMFRWIPLSLCEESPEIGDEQISVEEWFALQEGLI